MKRTLYLIVAMLLTAAVGLSVYAGEEKEKKAKARDSFGRPDAVSIIVKEISDNQFTLTLNWQNDEKLAALTYPLVVTGKGFEMRYDSVSWVGRADYFTVKSAHPIDSLHQVLVGMVNDLGQGKPPLAESTGTVATLYFTAATDEGQKAELCQISVDTTFIPPSNVLYGVTPDGLGKVHPNYTVHWHSADGKEIDCK